MNDLGGSLIRAGFTLGLVIAVALLLWWLDKRAKKKGDAELAIVVKTAVNEAIEPLIDTINALIEVIRQDRNERNNQPNP